MRNYSKFTVNRSPNSQQVCIPVGCVPPALPACTTQGVCGVSASGGGLLPMGGLLSQHALRQSTSFAGGNNDVIGLVLYDQSKYSIPVTSDTSRIHKGLFILSKIDIARNKWASARSWGTCPFLHSSDNHFNNECDNPGSLSKISQTFLHNKSHGRLGKHSIFNSGC